jgi:hypothetical protein
MSDQVTNQVMTQDETIEVQTMESVAAVFPTEPMRLPAFVNACVVNSSVDSVILEFGFLDPYRVNPGPKTPRNNPIEVVPVSRIVMQLQDARDLVRQLEHFIKISDTARIRSGESQ